MGCACTLVRCVCALVARACPCPPWPPCPGQHPSKGSCIWPSESHSLTPSSVPLRPGVPGGSGAAASELNPQLGSLAVWVGGGLGGMDVVGHGGTWWDTVGRGGTDAVGCIGMYWDVLGCVGMCWDVADLRPGAPQSGSAAMGSGTRTACPPAPPAARPRALPRRGTAGTTAPAAASAPRGCTWPGGAASPRAPAPASMAASSTPRGRASASAATGGECWGGAGGRKKKCVWGAHGVPYTVPVPAARAGGAAGSAPRTGARRSARCWGTCTMSPSTSGASPSRVPASTSWCRSGSRGFGEGVHGEGGCSACSLPTGLRGGDAADHGGAGGVWRPPAPQLPPGALRHRAGRLGMAAQHR